MPQMAPLWWEVLFFLFMMCFMIMNIIIYYNKTNYPKKGNSFNKNYQMNWKW